MQTHMKGLLLFVGVGLLMGYSYAVEGPDEVPFVEGQALPAAHVGEGWTLVRRPATYKTVSETVEISPASSYLEVVPAKFETRAEQVLVSPEGRTGHLVSPTFRTETFQQLITPESSRYEIIPARFESAEEVVEVKAAHEELRFVPATYRTETEQIKVADAYTYWKKVGSGIGAESYCMCEMPAKFVTVNKQVLNTPDHNETVLVPAEMKRVTVQRLVADAQVNKVTLPAVYATLERTVLNTPATVAYDAIPARFETIQKLVLVEPEASRKIEMPAKFETITRQVLDQPATMVWRRVKCDCGDVVRRYKEIPGTDEASLQRYK